MSASQCRFCGCFLQHSFVDLGMSPLSNAFLKPEQLNLAEKFYPLHAYVCEKCFLVQLEEFESPEQIFSDYAYFSSYSQSWLQHAADYVNLTVDRFQLNSQSQVIEIASNDGYLLQYFVRRDIPVLGIEPAANVAEIAKAKGIDTLVKFFGTQTATELVNSGQKADLLLGNNVLAHVPDLNDFVKGMKLLLKPNGILTMEFPHLLKLIQQNQFDTIYHEHFSYFSFLTVERVFASHGLTLFDVEELNTHGGSLRIYGKHAEAELPNIGKKVEELKATEIAFDLDKIDTYLKFGDRVKATKRNLLSFLIQAKEAGKSIAAYGAAAKGNTLLNYCGVRNDFIDYCVDKSPYKQGLFLPGTHIPIYAPEKIQEYRPDYVLILPWNIQNEIMNQIPEIRDWGGKFIIPIPEVAIK